VETEERQISLGLSLTKSRTQKICIYDIACIYVTTNHCANAAKWPQCFAFGTISSHPLAQVCSQTKLDRKVDKVYLKEESQELEQ
jgi:hypothetical protein